jgi:hypothetical protein
VEVRVNQAWQQAATAKIDALGGIAGGATFFDGNDAIAVDGDELPGAEISRREVDQRCVIDDHHDIKAPAM